MQRNESKLTVFFEEPFWVGIYERITDEEMVVCKITFGAEPKDYEVCGFLQEHWNKLRFSPPVKTDSTQQGKQNPKRMQRAVKKELMTHGTGTKSRQALKLQQEEGKQARKQKRRLKKAEAQQRTFEIRQQKRKEKHRGR